MRIKLTSIPNVCHLKLDNSVRAGSKPPLGGVRSVAPAFRRGKRPPLIRARVAGGRKALPKMPLDVKSVARYAGSYPGR